MATLSAEDARGAGSGAAQSLPSSSKFVNDIMMLLDTENVQQLRREFSKQEEGLTLEEFVYVMKRFVNKAIARAHERSDVLQQQQRARRQSNASAHRASFSRRDSRRGSATKHRQQHQRGNSAGAAATSTIPAWMYDESQLVSAIVELFSQIDINGDGEMEWDEFTSFIVDSGLAANEHDPNAIRVSARSGFGSARQPSCGLPLNESSNAEARVTSLMLTITATTAPGCPRTRLTKRCGSAQGRRRTGCLA